MNSIRSATQGFNAFIAQQASSKGAVLVDIHARLNSFACDGVVVGGNMLTVDFLGGIFSLDGIHPTNTGHAILANEFIHELNVQAAAGIPPVAVVQVAKDDPLLTLGPKSPPGLFSSSCGVNTEMAGKVRSVLAGALPD